MIQCLDATLETVCGNVFSSYSTKSSSESFSSACTTSTGYTGLHLLCPPIKAPITFEETDGLTIENAKIRVSMKVLHFCSYHNINPLVAKRVSNFGIFSILIFL